MYIPKPFREDNRAIAFELIDAFGFATLISWSGGEPLVSHVPLMLDRSDPAGGRLLGHVARANEHWKRFDGKEPALAMFHGPHAYVSPAWYATRPSVPTWNYAVVHVHGAPDVLDSAATGPILRRLVQKYESPRRVPWRADLPGDFVQQDLHAIVGFQMPITRLDAKFKLSQNKDAADREGALAGLEMEDDPGSRALAAFARRYFERQVGS